MQSGPTPKQISRSVLYLIYLLPSLLHQPVYADHERPNWDCRSLNDRTLLWALLAATILGALRLTVSVTDWRGYRPQRFPEEAPFSLGYLPFSTIHSENGCELSGGAAIN